MIHITCIDSLKKAQEMWEILSLKKNSSDDFSFRYAYYRQHPYPLYFYTAYINTTVAGLLPLQFNTDKGYLEFFGGSYFEDNQAFVIQNNQEIREKLITSIALPAHLEWMHPSMKELPNVTMQEYKYILPLDSYTDTDDYLQKTWSTKARQNLRSQIRKLYLHKIEIIENRKNDFTTLIEFNKKHFGNESTFLKNYRIAFFTEIIRSFPCLTISIFMDNELVAVGLSLLYNNVYVGLNSGRKEEINGLGKFLQLKKIEQAIRHHAVVYDARAEDLGWKESFHFQRYPQYQLII